MEPGPYLVQQPARRRLDAPATVALIALNVAVWLAVLATGGNDSPLLYWFSLHLDSLCLIGGQVYGTPDAAACVASAGTYVPGMDAGAAWELLTNAFTHVNVVHIALNMITLWVLGRPLERLLGVRRFLALYLISGLAGSAAVYWLADATTFTVGASGAIFGLLGALAVITWLHKGDFQQVMVWLVINLIFTFSSPGISWQGHLGGLLGGALVTWIDQSRLPRARRRLLLAALTVALLVLVALRLTLSRS